MSGNIETYAGKVALVQFAPGFGLVEIGLENGKTPVGVDFTQLQMPDANGGHPTTWDGTPVKDMADLVTKLLTTYGARIDAVLRWDRDSYRAAWGEFVTTPR